MVVVVGVQRMQDPIPGVADAAPFCAQFRHKSDNQVNNRQSQVLISGV